ncbi:MAG: hypothetical protein ACI8XO_000122 [Verrucomicrobiales bacterium]|jgi:hypothetical protein
MLKKIARLPTAGIFGLAFSIWIFGLFTSAIFQNSVYPVFILWEKISPTLISIFLYARRFRREGSEGKRIQRHVAWLATIAFVICLGYATATRSYKGASDLAWGMQWDIYLLSSLVFGAAIFWSLYALLEPLANTCQAPKSWASSNLPRVTFWLLVVGGFIGLPTSVVVYNHWRIAINATHYSKAIFIVTDVGVSNSGGGRSGNGKYRWALGSLNGKQEWIGLAGFGAKSSSTDELKLEFPPDTELDVWHDPGATDVITQGRTLNVIPGSTKGLSVNNSYNLLVILAITRVRFQLK